MKKLLKKVLILSLSLALLFTFLPPMPVNKVEAFAPALVLVPAIGGTVVAACEIAKYTFTAVVVVLTIGNICRVYRQDDIQRRFVISSGLPYKGTPNSTAEKKYADGKVSQKRWYGPDGKPTKDIDYGDHNKPNNHPNPHQHNWPGGIRGTPLPLGFWSKSICTNKFCLYES